MSKRKVHFDDAHGEQGDVTRRFKDKHSLDSDEEDDAIEEKLDEDDIEGMLDIIWKALESKEFSVILKSKYMNFDLFILATACPFVRVLQKTVRNLLGRIVH